MEEQTKAIKRAEREGWATYMPTSAVLLSGALAALAVMLSPFVLYAVVAFVATLGELVRQGWVNLYGTVYVNMRSFAYYVRLEWPYIIAGTALGVPLAYLRQRYGFYFLKVRGNQYRYYQRELPVPAAGSAEAARPVRPYKWKLLRRAHDNQRQDPRSEIAHTDEEADRQPLVVGRYQRKFMLPIYPHELVLYLAGPLFLVGMAYHADPLKYPPILYNMFAVWLTSGVLALLVWDRLQIAFLKLMSRRLGAPSRNLTAEYQLKRLLEEDPALSYYGVWDVAVDVQQRHATVYGNISGKGAMRRLNELVAFIEGVESVEVVPTDVSRPDPDSEPSH